MKEIIDFLNGNGVTVIVAAFVLISVILSGVQAFLQAIGKKVPGWMGKAIDILGKVVGFINGNFAKKPEAKV